MARLIMPDTAKDLKTLADKVKAKDTADGATSIIKPFMTENDIVIADVVTAIDDAVVVEQDRNDLAQKAETEISQRDVDWKNPWLVTQAAAQNLKKFYFTDPAKVNLWGIPITVDGRINYPPDFLGRTAIFKAIKAKHDTYSPATASPLNVFLVNNNVNLSDMDTLVDAAILNHNNGTSNHEAAETLTADLNNLLKPNAEKLSKIGYFLMSSFPQNPHKANDWGYRVDNAARGSRTQKSTILPLGTKTLSNLVLGGEMKNDSAATVLIYKGKTATGTAVTLAPNAKFVPTKGYSQVTIVNSSATETAILNTLITR